MNRKFFKKSFTNDVPFKVLNHSFALINVKLEFKLGCFSPNLLLYVKQYCIIVSIVASFLTD